jgi:phosphate starvation-inducible protein PhoH and related proteins
MNTNNNSSQKRKPKNPIKFKLQLTEEQKLGKATILDNKITVVTGKAGSSKTFLCCNVALDLLFTKQIEKIIIMRPMVGTEDIGHLPGDINDKMQPWMTPIIENMYDLYDKTKIEKEIVEGRIRILPLQFTQGVTFRNSAVIVDEAQNCTKEQLKMILTRTGIDSKIMIAGDPQQIQIRRKSDSGLSKLIDVAERIDKLALIHLTSNYRDPIVEQIIDEYDN